MERKKLEIWVNDQIQTVFGFSEKYLVDYMIELAKQESNEKNLFLKN